MKTGLLVVVVGQLPKMSGPLEFEWAAKWWAGWCAEFEVRSTQFQNVPRQSPSAQRQCTVTIGVMRGRPDGMFAVDVL